MRTARLLNAVHPDFLTSSTGSSSIRPSNIRPENLLPHHRANILIFCRGINKCGRRKNRITTRKPNQNNAEEGEGSWVNKEQRRIRPQEKSLGWGERFTLAQLMGKVKQNFLVISVIEKERVPFEILFRILFLVPGIFIVHES